MVRLTRRAKTAESKDPTVVEMIHKSYAMIHDPPFHLLTKSSKSGEIMAGETCGEEASFLRLSMLRPSEFPLPVERTTYICIYTVQI